MLPGEPTAAPIPSPGLYWLRVCETRFVFDRDGTRGGSYHTWEQPELHPWSVAEVVEDGSYYLIGSDEWYEWNDGSRVVVGVRLLEAPPE